MSSMNTITNLSKYSLQTRFIKSMNIAGAWMLLAEGDFPEVPRTIVVNRDGIHVDPSKVESVKNWKTLESSTEIHSFLGLAGYYRRFIENFSKIANPLTMLTQKNKAYVWGDKQDEAFQILKGETINAPVLALLMGPDGLYGLL
ncbi:hypothetical protein Tco_0704589 [Tanacetum coccineum]|uniref:Reverse transcriptase/retrotransposon-derived protein RNase H-like domain-containing protein n=1 Tax=Tanacetum coccineum TaxID=301880 RepID=A0ABQ4Y456_9ASTR